LVVLIDGVWGGGEQGGGKGKLFLIGALLGQPVAFIVKLD